MLGDELRTNATFRPTLNALQLAEVDAITAKIDSGDYETVEWPCPTCGVVDFEALAERDRYGLPYSLVVCRRCGLLQVSPRLDAASVSDFYEHHYRRLYVGSDRPSVSTAGARRRGRDALDFVTEELPLLPGTRVVEIGCGTGMQLEPFARAGMSTVGYDYDDSLFDVGRAAGLDLRVGGIERLVADVSAGDEPPAVLAYIHTFEHLVDPAAEADHCAEVLGQRGLLYLEVPGLENVFRTREHFLDEYFEFAHTFHFDRRTLAALFGSKGWACLKSDNHVRAVFTPAPRQRDAMTAALEAITALEAARAAAGSDRALTADDAPELLEVLLAARLAPAQAHYEVGRRLADHGDPAAALVSLRAAHELDPDRGKYAFRLAMAMEEAGEPADLLVEAYREAARLIPASPNPHYRLGNALQQLERHEQAIGAYARAIELDPTVAIFRYQLGHAHFRMGSWELARRSFAAAHQRDPDLAWAAHCEGLCWYQLGEFGRAIEAHERAHEIREEEAFLLRRDEARRAMDGHRGAERKED